MILRTHIPRFPLDQFIPVLPTLKVLSTLTASTGCCRTGTVKILISLHDAPQFIYDNKTLKQIRRDLWLK